MIQLSCQKCTLPSGLPGVSISPEGVCNYCENGMTSDYGRYRELVKLHLEFEASWQRGLVGQGSPYDCMVMLSGSENSVYFLYHMVNHYRLSVLAFTINHPYKSSQTLELARKYAAKIGVDHVVVEPEVPQYKQLLRYVFSHYYSISNQKAPCIACAGFLQITAYLYALEQKIPYIFCVDREQTALLPVKIAQVVGMLVEICGQSEIEAIFGPRLGLLLNRSNRKAPKIMYPYYWTIETELEKVIAPLRKLKLYEPGGGGANCILHPLLDYYSFQKYGCQYYAFEIAQRIRRGELDREVQMQYVGDYRNIIANWAVKSEIAVNEQKEIQTLLENYVTQTGMPYGDYENILQMRKLAGDLGLELTTLSV